MSFTQRHKVGGVQCKAGCQGSFPQQERWRDGNQESKGPVQSAEETLGWSSGPEWEHGSGAQVTDGDWWHSQLIPGIGGNPRTGTRLSQ